MSYYDVSESLNHRDPVSDKSNGSIEQILGFFVRATAELGTSLNWDECVDQFVKLMVPDLADSCSVWWIQENGTPTEIKNFRTDDADVLNHSDDVLLHVIKTGETEVHKEVNGSTIYAPMRIRNQIAGVLVIYKKQKIFSQQDLVVVQEVGYRGSIALDNARVYQELKKTQENLIAAKDSAEVANRAKSLFLANMSHEIRTPLTAIIGFIDLIQGTNSTDKNNQFLFWEERIKANGLHLLKIVDEILDISKIESGNLSIQSEPMDIDALLVEVYHTLFPISLRRKNKLEFLLESPIPKVIDTDPTRFRQILINVIGNAIKFTESGTITLRCRYDKELAQLTFIVTDTGIGLTADQIQKIFHPFSQGDASHTRRFGGTGLGLALSRQLAQCLGGQVSLCDSLPGKGSSFKIEFPTGLVPKNQFIDRLNLESSTDKVWQPTTLDSVHSLSGRRVLLAEDAPDSQLIITLFLKQMGIEVEVASDGAEALKMGLHHPYDLILMDIQMPILNGHTVSRRLRNSGFKGPIIALTAHVLKEEHDESIRSGCNEVLTKPIDRKKLLSTIRLHVQP